jgi:hypothetical protein
MRRPSGAGNFPCLSQQGLHKNRSTLDNFLQCNCAIKDWRHHPAAILIKAKNCLGRIKVTAKEFAFSTEAREKMLRGIDTLAGAMRVTLGPKGRAARPTCEGCRSIDERGWHR